MLEQQIEQDLKTALLAHNATEVSTLRVIKSVLLNEKVATGQRETGLTDQRVIALLSKEAKKRQESADLYVSVGDQERADSELTEKEIIEHYLPAQLSETELSALIDETIVKLGENNQVSLGQVIADVKQATQGAADGALIAKLTKEKLAL